MQRKEDYLSRLALTVAFAMMLTNSIHAESTPADQCRFIGIHEFGDFSMETNGEKRILVSPVIKAPINWNELVVSWNATAPKGSWIQIEGRGVYPEHQTKYYTLAVWSAEAPEHPRHSVRNQKDNDGDVQTDTWLLREPGAGVQLRLTLSPATGSGAPQMKFIGLSFLDSRVQISPLESDRRAWGKIIVTPERSQHSYPEEEGWCSPTALSMVLGRWSNVLNRPELDVDVPEVAAKVYDGVFGGTGNWPFNTAFAGSFPGMRAYVARFSDLTEVENWIDEGMPVILSAPWHMLSPGRKNTGSGHLVVCIGFTEKGDVVINDPATNLEKGQSVRHIYERQNVREAWKVSRNTVYLIYPETVAPPADLFGHWDKP